MKELDINADMGESYGSFKIGQDDALMPFLTSCNIACGFHGGDPLTIKKTILLAIKHDVAIGAHPSYPDLVGFGRRRMNLSSSELSAALLYQIAAVKSMAESLGAKLHHVKPHGALNNHMMDDDEVLDCVLNAIYEIDPNLPIYIPYTPNFKTKSAPVLFEIFADRTYEKDLTLTKRSIPGSLISTKDQFQPHLEQILKNQQVNLRQGGSSDIQIDTLCIHGDNPGALDIAKSVNTLAKELRIEIKTVYAGQTH